MRILHLGISDLLGGASKASYLIHKTLLKDNIESRMLVLKKLSDDDLVFQSKNRFSNIILAKLERYWLRKKIIGNISFSSNYFSEMIIDNELIKWADLVNIHWIGNSTLSYSKINYINKPLVWRLSDQFPFTGGCHFSGNCNNYEQYCGNCYLLKNSNEDDLSKIIFINKNKYIQKFKSLTIVSPSEWMDNKIKKSTLFKERNKVVIHTGIDTNIFKNNSLIKSNKNKINLLFIADDPIKNERKGYNYLEQLVNQKLSLEERKKCKLIIIGEEDPSYPLDLNIINERLGKIENLESLKEYYSKADILIAPYLEDNLPNTILEAMACETVVLSFKIGGIPEIIDHKINGYLSLPNNIDDFYNGFRYLINNNFKDLKIKARSKVVEKFNKDINYKKYIDLYQSLLK